MGDYFVINELDKSRARTEAAVYAEGTPYTRESLYSKWIDACNLECELLPVQSFFEQVLREDPEFEESWLE